MLLFVVPLLVLTQGSPNTSAPKELHALVHVEASELASRTALSYLGDHSMNASTGSANWPDSALPD